MCRFLIFKGTDDIRLSNLLTRPAHSIINQSYDSRLRLDLRRPMNGDGFGLGYYTNDFMGNIDKNGPCVFRAITPAWNNQNLEVLAEKTQSKLVFAHVRASTYGSLSETNCHPFVYHSLMFMHNGGISNFAKMKRKILNLIDEEFFLYIQGSTDSEVCFALFLHCLKQLGCDPSKKGGNFGDKNLREALKQTIATINLFTDELLESNGDIVHEPSLMNFAVTDSSSVVISRYISSKTQEAASLHFACGSAFTESSPGQYIVERLDRKHDVIMVASEPLTFERNDWITVPTNTLLTIKNQTVLLHPIIDKYYQPDLVRGRSSDFAISKGLMGPVPIENSDSAVPPLEREGRMSQVPRATTQTVK